MAFILITTPNEIIRNSVDNCYTLFENNPSQDLVVRLATWRVGLFPLLNTDDPLQARIHQWIVVNLALEAEIGQSNQNWWQVQRVVDLLARQASALTADGYTPSASQDAAIVALYNTTWAQI